MMPPPATAEGPGAGQNYIGSWSTPALVKIDGRDQLLAALPGAVYDLDPANGHEIWHCNGLNPLAYAQPILVDNVVVGLGGFNGFSMGVKPGGSGDVTATHRLWQDKRDPQRIGSGVTVDGKVYLGSASGIVQCLDPQTGKLLTDVRPPVPVPQTASWSSFVRSGDRLYLADEELPIHRSSSAPIPKWGALRRQFMLNDGHDQLPRWPSPTAKPFQVRTHTHLWCIHAK